MQSLTKFKFFYIIFSRLTSLNDKLKTMEMTAKEKINLIYDLLYEYRKVKTFNFGSINPNNILLSQYYFICSPEVLPQQDLKSNELLDDSNPINPEHQDWTNIHDWLLPPDKHRKFMVDKCWSRGQMLGL